MGETIRLNLGSNDVKHEGFLNVDIRDIPEVDIVDDVITLNKIEDCSVAEMVAHNILGQIAPDKVPQTLRTWHSKLKSGGTLSVGVPDGELLFGRYLKGDYTWERVVHGIFGNMSLLRKWHGDDAERWMGHSLYTEDFITELLKGAGFVDIRQTTQNHSDVVTMLAKKP